MIVYIVFSIFINCINGFDECNGWGHPVAEGTDCPSTYYRTRTNKLNTICCIPQPDCPPGLLPETPQDPNKEYDGTLEIGCTVPSKPESSPTSPTSNNNPPYEIHIEESNQPWIPFIAIGCTVAVLLFAGCVGSVIVIETTCSMRKTITKQYKV